MSGEIFGMVCLALYERIVNFFYEENMEQEGMLPAMVLNESLENNYIKLYNSI